MKVIPIRKHIRLENESTKDPSQRNCPHVSSRTEDHTREAFKRQSRTLPGRWASLYYPLEPFTPRLLTTSNVHINTPRFQKVRSTSAIFPASNTFYHASNDECCRHANADQDKDQRAEEQNSKYQLKQTAIGPNVFPPQVHLVIVVLCVILDGMVVVAVMMNFSLFRVVVIIWRR